MRRVNLNFHLRYEYAEVSRTLCPINSTYSAYRHPGLKSDEITIERSARDARSNTIDVEISTSTSYNLTYEVEAELIRDFIIEYGSFQISIAFLLNSTYFRLNERQVIDASPSHPQYFRFSMPESVSRVLIQITSDSNICMVVSVQPIDVSQNQLLIRL